MALPPLLRLKRYAQRDVPRGAFLAPLAADSFNRANSGTLGNTDGVLVGRPGGGGLAWTETNGDWQITSTTLGATGVAPGDNGKFVASVDAGAANLVGRAKHTGNGATKGLCLRISDNLNWWLVTSRTTDNTLKIIECNAGTTTSRASVAVTPGAGDVLVARLSGTVIEAWHKSAAGVITATSYSSAALNAAATLHGVRTDLTNQTFDDFSLWPLGMSPYVLLEMS